MKSRLVIITSIFLVFAFQMLAVSQEAKKAEATPQALIEHQLAQKGLLANNNIQVYVAGKVVTLKGEVPTINARKRAEREVKNVESSYAVINELKVKFSSVADSVLAKIVQDRINGYVFYSIFDWVTVEANNGAITLKGSGHLPWTAKQIQLIVEKIKNVQKIDNQIQFVQGPDDIRFEAARAIYNDPMFENYAYMPYPPVHIIVNGPEITLEGNLDSESLRGWAGVLAEFNSDAIKVMNNIRVSN
jgi:osmotically-inducible protein OsmY